MRIHVYIHIYIYIYIYIIPYIIQHNRPFTAPSRRRSDELDELDRQPDRLDWSGTSGSADCAGSEAGMLLVVLLLALLLLGSSSSSSSSMFYAY